MKKITFVIGILGKGGAERVIVNLANAFVKYGWQIDIITIYGDRQDYVLDENIRVTPILCKCPIRILRPFERFIEIRKNIKKIKPNLVVSFLADVNIHVIVSLLGVRQKLIVSERNDPQSDPEQKWMRKLRDKLYTRADGAVFQTEDAKAYFKSILTGNTTTTIIPNPIKEGLPYYNKMTKSNHFITACRLNKQKNLPLMIDAMGKLIEEGYECELDIYGDGILHEEIQSYIQNKHLDRYIHLCGFSKNIHEKMKDALGFVISSDYEGISNSMLEALAIGIPVIATDCPVGGARMYLKNNVCGYLVPCRDVNRLADAMCSVLINRDEAIQRGENATEIRKILDPVLIADQWRKYLMQFL